MDIKKILEQHKIWVDSKGDKGVRANLSGTYLRGENLSDANLRGANLSDANLTGADLSGANLSVADLSGADLSGANLSDAYLRGANLSDAYLSVAYLNGADLHDADLSDANLSGANLNNIKGKNIITFSFNRHFAYSCDGYIKIGCRKMSIREWEAQYRKIGMYENYSEKEIELYGEFIKICGRE